MRVVKWLFPITVVALCSCSEQKEVQQKRASTADAYAQNQTRQFSVLLFSRAISPKPADQGYECRPQNLGPRWVYFESDDKMGRGTIKTAGVHSRNVVELVPPDDVPQRATLELVSHPEYGDDAIFALERGGITLYIGDSLLVRFGEQKAVNFPANQLDVGYGTVLFIGDFDRFVENTKRVSTIYVEVPLFRNGDRVFEFDVSGLVWHAP